MPSLLHCAGLPLVEQRALTTDEISRIRRWSRRITLKSLGFVGGIFGLSSVLVVAGMLTRRREWETFGVFAGAILIYTNLHGILLRIRDPFRFLRLADRETEILAFAGVLRYERATDPTGAILLFERLLEANTRDEQRVDVFRRSGLIWRVNGKTLRRSIRATVSDLTNVPEFAKIAAKWTVPVPDDPRYSVRDRFLSPEERAELKALARRSFPARRVVLIVASAGFLAGIAGRYGLRALIAELPFWAFLAWGSFRTSKQIRFSVRLFRHLRSGRVTIVRISPGADETGPPSEEATWEFLAGSNCTWNINGQPIAWRGAGWSFWRDASKRLETGRT